MQGSTDDIICFPQIAHKCTYVIFFCSDNNNVNIIKIKDTPTGWFLISLEWKNYRFNVLHPTFIISFTILSNLYLWVTTRKKKRIHFRSGYLTRRHFIRRYVKDRRRERFLRQRPKRGSVGFSNDMSTSVPFISWPRSVRYRYNAPWKNQ